ncbi:unnamed protein product [Gongylonema pulchrum]|uniref:Uncharacterized protein n=1 Tax=Gongylonema pulchrum TaxID=637853 RepID=A0A183ET10_9BILA|nr:unnamed protein product [Gongylonema pulchrum]
MCGGIGQLTLETNVLKQSYILTASHQHQSFQTRRQADLAENKIFTVLLMLPSAFRNYNYSSNKRTMTIVIVFTDLILALE